jgi:hypothetical protein
MLKLLLGYEPRALDPIPLELGTRWRKALLLRQFLGPQFLVPPLFINSRHMQAQ